MRRWHEIERAARNRGLADIFAWLDMRELEIVRRYVLHTEHRALRFAALTINRLSNGLMYPIVAATILMLFGRSMVPAVVIAASFVLIGHVIYPVIKAYCARGRPFECDATIPSLLKPLDRHSFPSGHTMTATAAFLPLSAAAPHLTPLAVAGILSIGWARLAAGHHYPSDVLGGALLGAVIVSPGLLWLLY